MSCEICSHVYNCTETVPRVLDCGHSFCTSCITQPENNLCPNCRANITRGKEFPVNYSLLSLVEEYKLEISDNIVSKIENLKEKLNFKLSVMNKMLEIVSEKESTEFDLELLTSLENEYLNEENESKSEIKMIRKLHKLEEKYKEWSIINYLYFDVLDKFSGFSLQNGETSYDFLQKIYLALKNLEKVFAYEIVNNKLKFGELTIRDNKIMIHSMTLNEIPRGAKIVQFKDMKKSLLVLEQLLIFLEITTRNSTSRMIIIKPHDEYMVPCIMNLCTAEKGPSYKNLPFSKGNNSEHNKLYTITNSLGHTETNEYRVTSLESILEVKFIEDVPLDYYKNISSTVSCVENDVILTEALNDGFQLLRVLKPGKYITLGKVIYSSDFWKHVTYNDGKILDCGLVIYI